ncbi:MAG: hypothetical protein ACI9TI_001214 [Natronomonas sp.]|jgi:hypothetical protein|uniref:DUF7563 family protein n=1 Tax=Natronomonas sp. TaxID=2184060 RepID=UPI003988A69D
MVSRFPETQAADSPTARRCSACGAFVSRRFRQVFGDNDDEVNACLNCTTARRLTEGASAVTTE